MQPVRFRGTLASRVSLLAALAVTLSIVFGSLAAYAVIRHQLYASLDASLEQRATAAASTNTLATLTAQRIPAWMLGAGDIKIAEECACLPNCLQYNPAVRRTAEDTQAFPPLR